MKKIVHTPNQPERKVMALLGIGRNGYYTRDDSGAIWWHSSLGGCTVETAKSWAELSCTNGRVKVYEGDSITITF